MLASETIVIYRVSVMVEAMTDSLNNNKTAVMKIIYNTPRIPGNLYGLASESKIILRLSCMTVETTTES